MRFLGLHAFDALWGVDWEYPRPQGDLVFPVCCAARELRSGRLVTVWFEGRETPPCPYDTGPRSLYVGFSVIGDLGCHAALGWPMPHNVIDLFVEFRNDFNGLVGLAHTGLGEVLQRYKLPHMAAAEKATMIDLILEGGPWDADQQAAILQYCASDTEALAHLLPAMLPQMHIPHALQRGRYVRNAAIVERRGISLDAGLRQTLIEHWEPIQDGLIAAINPTIGYAYDGRHFRMKVFEAWVDQQPFVWPRTPKRHDPKTDDETLKMLAMLHPEVEPFRQLTKTLRQMRLITEMVGTDHYNRPGLRPFWAVTGRNIPRTKESILGAAAWLRSLIQPPPGHGMAYIDWVQQEYGIVAVFSNDPAMLEGYGTGDPYLRFGQLAGAIPAWGTKATHGPTRELYKTCVLGTLYGMGATSLAQRIGKRQHVGRQLLHQHQQTYRNFWSWADRVVRIARHEKRLSTVFGWHLHWDPTRAEADCPGITARTMRNFPAQSHGSEMLRLALSFAVEAGVEVSAPLHDAFLIQAPIADLDDAVQTMVRAMNDASEVILQGFRLRTDVHTFVHPAHYHDPRGQPMWQIVKPLLPVEVVATLDV